MKKLKIGVIGLGGRGNGLLKSEIIPMCETKADVVALCDLYEDRVKDNADMVEKEVGKRPFETTDYMELINHPEVEAVVIISAWESHIKLAIASMKAGKPVAMEVGGAYSIKDCWDLVDTYEETGVQCMLLENCCYGKRELMVLNMVRQGLFGEVVHCDGGYQHDLRYEIANGKENRHYRLRNYMNRNCENYPTHEIGPIAKVLNINNGNRMVSLTSTASCAKGLHDYIIENKGADSPLAKVEFNQGDIVTTVIKCAKGQTITIALDTTLPRSYSRNFTVRGTKAAYFESNDCLFMDGIHNKYEFDGRGIWGNAKEFEEKYNHPIWKDYTPVGGHDGMDTLEFEAFFDAMLEGHRVPIDVYDAATYMCITALSEESILKGSAPVMIPDFTRGKWYNRTDIEEWKYSLDIKNINAELYPDK